MMSKGLGANSAMQIMARHNPVSKPCEPNSRTHGISCTRALALLIALIGLPFGILTVSAQEGSGQTPSPTIQAARAKSANPGSSQWPGRNSDPSTASQPKVRFEDGLLTINATNTSLSDVLFAVRSCTGADIDIPNNASMERVTVQLGPGPARKVLSDLLGWSTFDYIIQGSATDTMTIQSVTLMPRIKSATTGTLTTTAPSSLRVPQSNAGHQSPEEVTPVVAPPATEIPETPNATDQQPSTPDGMAPIGDPRARPVPVMPTGVSNSGKSTSEMIQELQQMYEQRRTMQPAGSQLSAPKSPGN